MEQLGKLSPVLLERGLPWENLRSGNRGETWLTVKNLLQEMTLHLRCGAP
jgi:hypothetical protein